jgi:signal transduction histidine kinase
VLLEISRAVASTLELKPLLELILDQLQLLIPYAGASVDLNEDGMLRQVAVKRPRGPTPTPGDTKFSFPLSVFAEIGRPLGEDSAQIIDDVHGPSKEAAHYRSLFGGDLKGTPVEYVRSFIGFPLIARDRIVGTLTMAHDEPGFFGPQHIELLIPIASQAAVAIDNARLYEEAKRRARETSALLEVSRAVASTLDTRALMGVILDQLKTIIDHTGSAVLRVVGDELEIMDARAAEGSEEEIGIRIPLVPHAAVWRAIQGGDPVIIADVRSEEPMAQSYRTAMIAAGLWDLPPFRVMQSWMAVPLISKGQVIGMLTASHSVRAYFNAEHARLARAFADQAAIAIDNAELFEQAQHRARETSALLEISRAVALTLDAHQLMGTILEQLKTIIDHTGAAIMLVVDGELEIVEVRAIRGHEPEIGVRLPLEEPLTGLWEAILRGEAVIIDDLRSDEAMAADFIRISMEAGLWELPNFQVVRSWMGVPLSVKGEVKGILACSQTVPAFFKPEHVRLARAFADQAAIAIENARLYEQAQRGAAIEERQRIARELHDSVSQALYAIALGARTARTLLDRDPAAAGEPVDYLSSLAEAGLTEMRALIFELRPESLETEGLVAAISKQAAAVEARHGLRIECRLDGEPQLPLAGKETLYRITQEALHNTVKHARATAAGVTLESKDSRCTVTIYDDGAGFDPADHFPGHLGLQSMKERAEKSGGTLVIDSAPGRGTSVKVSVPL